jgi:DNA-binding transcriptional LysR family regulator
MQDINLSGLDLNLIPQLAALLRRRNVTHAAHDVGLSQPAMSRALARLRDELDDLLLVRGSGGLVLTPKAERLRPRLESALTDLKAIFRDETFDPATEKRVIRLAALDTQAVLIAPSLMARLATLAPGISLRIETYTTDLVARMERGELDLAYALASTPLPPGAMSEPVADDRYALVMRRGHPLASNTWTLADYGEVDHAVVAIFGDGHSDLDAVLAANGLSRRLAFMAPNFISVIAVVAATDLVTTISRAFAQRLAPAFDLILKEPPFPRPGLPMTLVWSRIRTNDPVHAWFRALVRDVTAEVYADAAPQALP